MAFLLPLQDTLKAAEWTFPEGAGTYKFRTEEGRRYSVSTAGPGTLTVQHSVGSTLVTYEDGVLIDPAGTGMWVIATSQWVYVTVSGTDATTRLRFIDVKPGA